jgi:rare lipoprotein A
MKKAMRVLIFAAAVAPLFLSVPASSEEIDGARPEFGLASWYGYPFHGRATASGEIYDMELISAAHRTLPLDSWVRVTNLVNHKSLDVRITDRGPFIDGRVIDLSKAAARELDILECGTAQVRIDPVSMPSIARAPLRFAAAVAAVARFAVQVGAFHQKANAEKLRARLERSQQFVRIVEKPGDQTLWRVLVGSESTRATAEDLAQTLSGFVVESDDVPSDAMDVAALPGND